MHKLLVEKMVESVRRRVAQGDCPIEPAYSVEILEHCIVELAADPVEPKVSSDVDIEIERLIRSAMQDEFLLGQNADDRMERRYATASKVAATIATLRASDPSRELVERAIAVVDLIEGFPGYGTATNGNGRLKDQPAWVKFYNLTHDLKAALAQGQSR